MIVKRYESGHQLIPDEGDSIHERALRYCRENEGTDYRTAVLSVLKEDKALAERYMPRRDMTEDTTGMIQAKTYSQARDELHNQTQELMVARGIGYAQAFREISSLPRNKLVFAKYVQNSAKRIIGDEGD